MCWAAAPIVMQQIALGLAVTSTAMAAYGSYQTGKYNEKVAENNAITAEYQAEDAEQRGELAEKQRRLEIEQLKGQQRASIASSGFVVGEGSAADVLTDTAALGEQDVLAIKSNAAREAWAYRVQATNSRSQGQLARYEGNYQAGASLISGGASVADKWYRYNRDNG